MGIIVADARHRALHRREALAISSFHIVSRTEVFEKTQLSDAHPCNKRRVLLELCRNQKGKSCSATRWLSYRGASLRYACTFHLPRLTNGFPEKRRFPMARCSCCLRYSTKSLGATSQPKTFGSHGSKERITDSSRAFQEGASAERREPHQGAGGLLGLAPKSCWMRRTSPA